MLKDVTLGQYFPGNTIVHRLDPRSKLILVVLYIAGLFQASGWISYAAVTYRDVCIYIWAPDTRPETVYELLRSIVG